MKSMKELLVLGLLAAVLPITYANATLLDPTGDFLASYTGPHNGDMDVVSTDALFDGSSFILSATMNGAIGTTPGGFYVWGFDRGAGATTANFAALGLPGIAFDSIILINANGTGSVRTLGAGGTSTNLSAGAISINGDSFTASISSSLLPSMGFAFGQYTQNLWPRVSTGAQPIPDFAPDASMAPVRVPEPASLSLLGLGLAAAGMVQRRRKQK